MAISKIVYKTSSDDTGTVWMDTTDKTVEANKMVSGITALKNDGTTVTGNLTSRSSSDLTVSGATVTVPAGVYSSQASKAVSSGSATAPATISGSSATVSTGTNTLTLSKTVSVTPSVTAGYVSSGTAGNSAVSLTASVNTRSSSDMTASTLTVTAPAGYYGSDATKTLTDENLIAGNIKKDVQIFGVTGSYEGGGSSTTVIVPEQTINVNDAYNSVSFLSGLVAGEDYIYTLNGVQQTETAWSPGGNTVILQTSNNNIAFEWTGSTMYLDATSSSVYGTYTVKIEQQSGGGGGGTTWETVYNGIINCSDPSGTGYYNAYINNWDETIDLNSVWRVTWDSVQYECVATWYNTDGDPYALGNYTYDGGSGGTEYPFMFQVYWGEVGVVIGSSGNHTFKLEKQVSGGSVVLTLGGVRPDAEIAKSWTFDQLAVADLGITIGDYSSTAITIQAAADLETVTLDDTNYDYCIAMRQLAYPIYNTNEIAAGRFAFYACTYWQDFFNLPGGTIRDGANVYQSAWNSSKTTNQMFIAYYTSSEALNIYSATTVTNMGGTYMYGNITSTKTGNDYTPKSPTLYLRGHSTYYNQTFWEATTDIRYQYIMELWRVPKGNLNYDGYALSSQIVHAVNCYNSNGKTLT